MNHDAKYGNDHADSYKKVTYMLVDEKDNFEMMNGQTNLIDERNCSSPREEESVNDNKSNSSSSVNNDTKTSSNTCSKNNHFISLNPCNQAPQSGPIFFFDLDNTLYPKSSGIAELMVERIELFFVNYLKLPLAESRILGSRYYKDYGLAIKGLIKHFSIDPAEYDKFVDGGLPLDDILKPTEQLTSLLDRLSRIGSCWVFTNAGKFHATRVLHLLQLDSYFSGIIYCDYSESNFPAKPDRLAFTRAMNCVGVETPNKCFFFDDSIGNIRTAQEIGWNVVYIDEDSIAKGETSIDEINVSLEVSSISNQNFEMTIPTIQKIEEIEKILKFE